jgi:acetyltransferase-like isoleucine patch superfamily enzyme
MRARKVVTTPLRAGHRTQSGFVRTWRRMLLVVRTKAAARFAYSRVDISIARDVFLGKRIRIQVEPGTESRLVVGSRTVIRDDVLFWVRGGTIQIGQATEIRRNCVMNSSGQLTVGDSCLLSYGASIGCADSVSIGDYAVVSEYSLIVDSSHTRTGPNEKFLDAPLKTKPTTIGNSVWLGGHVVVAMGVEIGDCAFVGAGSVVTRDVPAWWLAVGVPAKPIRQLDEGDLPAEP